MTNRIPPQPIGSKIETYFANPYNLSKQQKRSLDIFSSHDVDRKVTDPIEQLKLNALQNGDNVIIKFKKPNTDNIKWDGNKGTIETFRETDNYYEYVKYNFTRNNGKVKLENCEARYRSTGYDLSKRFVNVYTDKDGNLSIDDAQSKVEYLKEDDRRSISSSIHIFDKGFDGIPDTMIRNSGNKCYGLVFDKKVGLFGEFVLPSEYTY